jgi:hypothetical protein
VRERESERERERERERYSERERVIGSDSTLIAERERERERARERERDRERDWTLMPDVFMCIYMLVIGRGEREKDARTRHKERETCNHTCDRLASW